MTLIKQDFENASSGNFTVANSDDVNGNTAVNSVNLTAAGTATYTSSSPISDLVSLAWAAATSSDNVDIRYTTLNATTVAFQIYIRFSNTPSANIPFLQFRNSGGTQLGGIAMAANARIVITDSASATPAALTSDARNVTTNGTDYRIDGIFTTATSTTGRIRYSIAEGHGPPFFYYDSGATLNLGTTAVAQARFGKNGATPTIVGTQLIDDLRVDDTQAFIFDPTHPSNSFPLFNDQAFEIGTSLGSANAVPNPPSATTGDLVLQTVLNDSPGATNLSASTGWTQIFHDANSTIIKMAMFGRVLQGNADDALAVTGAAQDYCVQSIVFPAGYHGCTNANLATEIKVATAATGSSTTADPPSLDAGSSQNWLWLAVAGLDTTTASVFTADPTNYKNICWLKSASSTSSCSLAMAWRQNATQTENPGTFTNSSRDWLTQTVAVPPVTSGSGAITQADQTASGSGTGPVAAPSGSGTPTQAAQTSTATGSLALTATGAASQADQTAAGSGTQTITGSGTPTQDAQTASGAALVLTVGTGAATQADQTAAGTGAHTVTFIGSGTPAQADQTATGSGYLQPSATGSPTQEAQTATAAGSLSLTATGAAVQADQSASGSGSLTFTASGATSQADQTASAAGYLRPSATGTPSQADQTAAGVGALGDATFGTGTPNQAAQTATGSGTLSLTATGTPTQSDQTATGSYTLTIPGSGTASQASQTIAATGTVTLTATGTPTQDDQTANGSGVGPLPEGSGTPTQADQTCAGLAVVTVLFANPIATVELVPIMSATVELVPTLGATVELAEILTAEVAWNA